MIKKRSSLFYLLFLFCCTNLPAQDYDKRYPNSKYQPIDITSVKLNDGFWYPRIIQLQETTLPLLFDIAETQGKIDNFRIVSGRKKGKLRLYNAPDSDVYKLLEAVGFTLIENKNPSLENRADAIIDDIVAAQDSSGYLHTQYMIEITDERAPKDDKENQNKIKWFGFGTENKWNTTKDNSVFAYSQLYCAGHMMEAGVAYYKGTGKRILLDAAIKFADLICKVMTIEKIKNYSDHPEVEIGLMQIYEITGNDKYLKKANEISRYITFSRPHDLDPSENTKPLHEQRKAFGHCVRTAYIYAGATDVIRACNHASDLDTAMHALWSNITDAKMYVHGGTGNGTQAEQHGQNYELPILPTYSESCANIAQAQWNYRLNMLTGQKHFADLVEWLSYNSTISGISLDGRRFNYSNNLNIGTNDRRGKHTGVREEYLFCCPSKVPVFIAGIGRWVYARTNDGILVNMYIGSNLNTYLGNNNIHLSQKSNYPWSADVKISIENFDQPHFSIYLRIPQWLKGEKPIENSPYSYDSNIGKYTLTINGKKAAFSQTEEGYIKLTQKWEKGDVVELKMDMPIRRIHSSNKIAANFGRVAISRGPLLYCLEGIDNPFNIEKLEIPAKEKLSVTHNETIFNGIPLIEGSGNVEGRKVRFTAIPYYMWENRGIAPLRTLIIEDVKEAIEETEPEKEKKINTNG